jgi:hypothetical protein
MDRDTAMRFEWTAGLLFLLPLMACATAAAPEPGFRVEVIRTESVEQIDSIPVPTLTIADRRLQVLGSIGLGATGYELVPSGMVEHGVIELLITPRMPEEMAGLTVLTRYEYRLTTGTLAPGSYAVRLRYAREGDGDPVVAFEGRITVE